MVVSGTVKMTPLRHLKIAPISLICTSQDIIRLIEATNYKSPEQTMQDALTYLVNTGDSTPVLSQGTVVSLF